VHLKHCCYYAILTQLASGPADGTASKQRKLNGSKSGKPKKSKDPNAPKKAKAKISEHHYADPGAPLTLRPGGPINLDLQCGVAIDSNTVCTKALSCKSHSQSLKRAVVGRSASFESLLQDFNARQDAQFTSEPAAPKAVTKLPEKKVKKAKAKVEVPQIYGEISDSDAASGREEDDSDSEDECDQVMTGLKQAWSNPKPFPGLVDDSSFLAVRNTRIARWRSGLAGALLDPTSRGN
jgi:hypothetical protein